MEILHSLTVVSVKCTLCLQQDNRFPGPKENHCKQTIFA